MKFPSERRLTYVTGAISNGNYTEVGIVNLPKDLSIVNRRNHTHTDPKGVPLVYQVRVDWFPSGLDGSGYTTSASSDVRTTVKFQTVPNNWVSKQAGIKWHEARMASLKRAGVKMKALGAYAKTIRYNWDEQATTFLAPYDGDGAAYAGGTWDTTKVFNAIDEDVRTTVKFQTVPNNWVSKQAGIKWHEARMASLKRAGVKMKALGAYAKTIRYNWDEQATTFLAPYDGDGAAYAGGTWDTTKVFNAIDEDGFTLRLLGSMDDEDGGVTTTDINAIGSYLQSRHTVLPDSNLEIENVPADKSMLLATLQGEDPDQDDTAYIRQNVRGEQDNPPYDEIIPSDTANDITEPSEAARIVMYPSQNSGVISTVFEAPYGMFAVLAANRDPGDNSGITDDMSFSVTVTDIYPMLG